ncbi:olfactory receptor 4N5-like [Coturnix japonica]|uniref:olfactory receptor 4N5-like n=1 Tax=Coturnix japonica TaxID=93934 RepID=UPI0007777B32|nr:olfactory receptor 4N5-like [Coturnix japonica]
MEHENLTTVREFVLLGLSHSHGVQSVLFSFFLLFYMAVLPSNVLIILTVWGDSQLGSPMHFFLANLAFLDICYCSVTLPKMLADLFSNPKTISYNSCMAQLLFLHFLGAAEIFLLLTMAYDRYVAICKPLRYTMLMNKTVRCTLLGASWGGGLIHGIILFALTITLPFCGPNILDNFFCDVRQLAKLACANTDTVELLMFLNNGSVLVVCFVLLLISYAALVLKLRAFSSEAKNKITSTCISHMVVVLVTFGPAIYIYVLPFRAVPMEKVIALFHTVIFPLMNPMIYTLCNKEIRSSIGRFVHKYSLWCGLFMKHFGVNK